MESKEQKPRLLIGKDIQWETIKGHFCRVNEWLPCATIEDGKLRAMKSTMPYAFLTIESPVLPELATMPIVHKEDFSNLWSVHEDRGIQSDEEVLVVYVKPRPRYMRAFASTLPRLCISVYPKGALEIIYNYLNGNNPNAPWVSPVEEWYPKWYERYG